MSIGRMIVRQDKQKNGVGTAMQYQPRSSVLFRYAALDLQQHQNQTDSKQDMPNSSYTGDSRIHTSGQRGPQHLEHSPHHQHHGGQGQAHMIECQPPSGFCAFEGKSPFQHKKKTEQHHTHQKIMGM